MPYRKDALRNMQAVPMIVGKLTDLEPTAANVITARAIEIGEARMGRKADEGVILSVKRFFNSVVAPVFSVPDQGQPLEEAFLFFDDMRDAILEYGRNNADIFRSIQLTQDEKCFLRLCTPIERPQQQQALSC